MEWLCQTPALTTIRVNLRKTTTEVVATQISKELQKYLPNVPSVDQCDQLPEVLLIGNLKNSIEPNTEHKEIITDAICAAALLRGAHVYAPGVLAMQSGTKINEVVDVYADLEGICKRGRNTKFDSKGKIFIGRGRVKMQRFQIFSDNQSTRGIAVEMDETVSGVPSIGDSYLVLGQALLQNLPSVICSRVLDPQENDVILDMCAAPGNKTTHLAELMNDRGILVALDKSEKRLNLLKEKITQFELKAVHCYTFDAVRAVNDQHFNTMPGKPPYKTGSFDKILLDAPCSGFGNRPLLANKLSDKMLASYPIVQKKLLATAIELLKSGGMLVYSTCTIFDAENEQVIGWALEKFRDKIELVAAEPYFGGPGWANSRLSSSERQLVQRFGPDVDSQRPTLHSIFNGTVGFFIAKIRKK